jgi:hypothetical protein
LLLLLPLQVLAVILNAVKDPEEAPATQSVGPFQPTPSRRCIWNFRSASEDAEKAAPLH